MTDTAALPRIIQRKQAPPPSDFAQQAAQVLGYRPLLDSEAVVYDDYKLVCACAAAGIRPFETKAVEDYKREKAETLNAAESTGARGAVSFMITEFYWAWMETSLRDYNHPMPKGVLSAALALASKLDGVEFVVHSLKRFAVVNDPFLEARYGAASLYIAVWDEPDFDAKYD